MRAPDRLAGFRLNRPLGAALWCLLILLGITLAASGLRSPHWLNSNLLAMLPQDTVPAATRQVSDRYRQTLSSTTLWLTPGDSPADAARRTEQLRRERPVRRDRPDPVRAGSAATLPGAGPVPLSAAHPRRPASRALATGRPDSTGAGTALSSLRRLQPAVASGSIIPFRTLPGVPVAQ